MAFDGIVTRSVVTELNDKILGGRIDKIYQLDNNELNINIYNKGENFKLLISANSDSPRIHFTDENKTNPQNPPMFCMLLRKYLSAGIILNIEQYSMDRIVFIDISNLDELGNVGEIRLIVEIMGRHSNVIMIEKETGKILDSIFRITEDLSRVRQILPGLTYELPPLQDKENILNLNRDQFQDLIDKAREGTDIFRFFYFNYLGLSPLVSKEICSRAGIPIRSKIRDLKVEDIELLYKEFDKFKEDVSKLNFKPSIYMDKGKIIDFYCMDLSMHKDLQVLSDDSMSSIIDKAFSKRDTQNTLNQKKQGLRKVIDSKLSRAKSKYDKQLKEYRISKDREKYKVYADILSANFYRIPKGAKSVELENFYSENMDKIHIPLNEKISAPLNADRYYKRYSKLKNAENLLRRYIPITKQEIDYLENVLTYIDNSDTLEQVEELREELISEGYIKAKKSKRRRKEVVYSEPHHYISSDGYDIYVGKNNKQNDRLTLRTANRDDIWLHVQNMPGSHVIVRTKSNTDLPEQTLKEAGMLAAYYSKGRGAKNIPVDYTERKNVNKARGAKPGMVFYNDFQTIFVNPYEDIIGKLEKKN